MLMGLKIPGPLVNFTCVSVCFLSHYYYYNTKYSLPSWNVETLNKNPENKQIPQIVRISKTHVGQQTWHSTKIAQEQSGSDNLLALIRLPRKYMYMYVLSSVCLDWFLKSDLHEVHFG